MTIDEAAIKDTATKLFHRLAPDHVETWEDLSTDEQENYIAMARVCHEIRAESARAPAASGDIIPLADEIKGFLSEIQMGADYGELPHHISSPEALKEYEYIVDQAERLGDALAAMQPVPDELAKLRAVNAYLLNMLKRAAYHTKDESEAAWLDDLINQLEGATEATSVLKPVQVDIEAGAKALCERFNQYFKYDGEWENTIDSMRDWYREGAKSLAAAWNLTPMPTVCSKCNGEGWVDDPHDIDGGMEKCPKCTPMPDAKEGE